MPETNEAEDVIPVTAYPVPGILPVPVVLPSRESKIKPLAIAEVPGLFVMLDTYRRWDQTPLLDRPF